MSVKAKVVLWYALLMLAIMVAVLGFIFYAGSIVSRETGRNALREVVYEAVEEISEESSKEKKRQHERRKDKQNEKTPQNKNNSNITGTSPEPFSTPETTVQPYAFLQEIDTFDDGVYISVYDEQGALIYGILPRSLKDENAPRFSYNMFQECAVGDEKWLFYDHVAKLDENKNLTVRGISSYSQVSDGIKTLLAVAVFAVPFIIALSVTGGYIITKRAFRPIKKISDTAEQISHDNDLSRRINLGKGKDEIHSLANTFDSMFDRLQEAFENEKQFTSDASHELRTPVSVIISQCEYSIENAQNLEEAKNGLEVVLKKAEKMSAIINQLLLLARADRGHQKINKENIDVAELTAMVVEEKASDADKRGISLNFKADESIIIEADETLLMRMLINLIDNAIKYGKEGGKVDIGITKNDQNMVVGYVSDDGIGISKEDLPHIFERFYRADKSRSQSNESTNGLGLAMVKWIVTAHNGEIIVKSEPDKGSTFIFMLPY